MKIPIKETDINDRPTTRYLKLFFVDPLYRKIAPSNPMNKTITPVKTS